MNHLFKSILTLCFLTSLSAQAFAADNSIVLGEYKGAGTLSVQRVDESGRKNEYQNECTVALNLYLGENSLDLPFGIFKCATGVDIWNEAIIRLGVQDGKLFNKDGDQVGVLSADGTYSFSVGSSRVTTVRTVHTDQYCQPERIETRKVKLEDKLSYTIKPLSGIDGFVISRVQNRDSLKKIYKSEHPNCPAGVFLEKEVETRSLENVTIIKK